MFVQVNLSKNIFKKNFSFRNLLPFKKNSNFIKKIIYKPISSKLMLLFYTLRQHEHRQIEFSKRKQLARLQQSNILRHKLTPFNEQPVNFALGHDQIDQQKAAHPAHQPAIRRRGRAWQRVTAKKATTLRNRR